VGLDWFKDNEASADHKVPDNSFTEELGDRLVLINDLVVISWEEEVGLVNAEGFAAPPRGELAPLEVGSIQF